MATVKVTKQAHLAYARLNQMQMVVLAETEISNTDLQEFIADVSDNYRRFGPVQTFFVYSKTARLNALQRKMITDAVRALGASFRANAIVTDSLAVRGMVTALSWIFPTHTASFSLVKVDKALDWLQTFCDFDKIEAMQVVDKMLGKVKR